jgi:hypothetical protein
MRRPCGADVSPDTSPDSIGAFLVVAAKFSEKVIAPLNEVGDRQSCRFAPLPGSDSRVAFIRSSDVTFLTA